MHADAFCLVVFYYHKFMWNIFGIMKDTLMLCVRRQMFGAIGDFVITKLWAAFIDTFDDAMFPL